MGSFADNQTAIVRTVGHEVDQSLQATEARLGWILVLMRPWLINWQIGTSGKTKVDSVKRDNQIFGLEDLLKSTNAQYK